jgi:diacylglycerol kinase family enzyme
VTAPGVVIVNPASGPDETSPADLVAHFPGAELLETDGSDLEQLVTQAVADGCPIVGVAGGDGTIRCAASVLAGSGVALLPIPAGTRNHFARELGIDTLERATEAWEGSDTRQVDLAEVNGERLTDLMARQSLDANTLDVRLLRADGRLARTRAVVAILLGRSGRSPLLETRTCDEITIELERRTTVDAALDGEVVRLDNPLHYRSLASALVVRVPPVRDGC